MHGSFAMKSDMDRLYVPRKHGGRGLVSVTFAVEHEKRNLSLYVHNSDDPYMVLVAKDYVKFQEGGRAYKQSCMIDTLNSWKEKPLHGQFLRETHNQICTRSQWAWLLKGNVTKEMEATVFAAQEQALSTNAIKAHIYGLPCSSRCRLCGCADETVDHLVSCCSYLVQREYKGRHDAVASLIHWTLAKAMKFPVHDCWWKHSPCSVLDKDNCKLLWDFTIVTDACIHHNCPGITFVDKRSDSVFLIDVAIPEDSRISSKSIEKLTKYVDFKIEIARMWNQRKCLLYQSLLVHGDQFLLTYHLIWKS